MTQDYNTLLRAELKDIPEEAAIMPLPRRLALKPIKNLIDESLGPLLPLMDKHAKLQSESHRFVDEAYEDPAILAYMNKRGYQTSDIAGSYLRHRQAFLKAPILTIAPGLKMMLEETGIKDNVPVKFLSAPFKTCYLEFEPAEQRKAMASASEMKTALVEGCYLQETILERFPDIPKAQREHLELDPNSPVRLLEISFTYSPIGNPQCGPNDVQVLHSQADYMAIFIQDENESIKDVIDRHMAFYALNGFHVANMDIVELAQFKASMTENLSKITKALFYLHVDRKTQVVQKPVAELEKRLESIGPKKQSKLNKQVNKAYDRILIGPLQYIPMAERFAAEDKVKGRRAPHYRRGYFGLRWVGTGQAKTTELVRVKESIIHEHLLTNREQRDYEMR
jgi:hypothetical protein